MLKSKIHAQFVSLGILFVLAVMIFTGSIAYAASYALNKEFQGTVQVASPIQVDLYTDATYTTRFTSTVMDFGTLAYNGNSFIRTLYFKPTEIDYQSVRVETVGVNTSVIAFSYEVHANGAIDYIVTPVGVGACQFTIKTYSLGN